MKTIIVPTDFSVSAENAVTYACEMNKMLKAKIVLLHTYNIPVLVTDSPSIPISDQEIRDIALDSLNRVKKECENKYHDMQFEIQASMGIADDEIAAYADAHSCDLLIMGTHGSSGLSEFLLGTVTATVMGKTSRPVLAIPEHAVYSVLEKIVFAADYGDHNIKHMTKIIALAEPFNAEIILLHVTPEELENADEDIEIGRFKEKLVEETGYSNISHLLLEDKNVYTGINNYIEQTKPDLLVISMRNRNLSQKLFSRSLTKRMAFHSHIPLLALHIPAE